MDQLIVSTLQKGRVNRHDRLQSLAGKAGGKYFADHGAKKVICVNTVPGAANLEARCQGVMDAMKEAGQGGEKNEDLLREIQIESGGLREEEGGVGIGGVLEPPQASPVIIEDGAFIGSRCVVVEGVVVGHHSVIGMGVFLSQSTRIYNRATGEITYGYIPPYSVVVSGSLPSKDGTHSLYCAVIVKQVDARTRSKTSVNDLLRGLAD